MNERGKKGRKNNLQNNETITWYTFVMEAYSIRNSNCNGGSAKTESIFSKIPFWDTSRRSWENYFLHRHRNILQQLFSVRFSRKTMWFWIYLCCRKLSLLVPNSHTAKTDFREILWIVKRNEFLIFFFFLLSGLFHVKRWCLMTIFRRIFSSLLCLGREFWDVIHQLCRVIDYIWDVWVERIFEPINLMGFMIIKVGKMQEKINRNRIKWI